MRCKLAGGRVPRGDGHGFGPHGTGTGDVVRCIAQDHDDVIAAIDLRLLAGLGNGGRGKGIRDLVAR